jgi:hypothetical protein
MGSILIGSILLLIILIIYFFFRFFQKPEKSRPIPIKKTTAKLIYCPLCYSSLEENKMVSKMIEYPDHRKMLEIYGCTICRKGIGPKERFCPSCKRKMEKNDFVFASYAQKEGVTRVVIKGCKNCYQLQ